MISIIIVFINVFIVYIFISNYLGTNCSRMDLDQSCFVWRTSARLDYSTQAHIVAMKVEEEYDLCSVSDV